MRKVWLLVVGVAVIAGVALAVTDGGDDDVEAVAPPGVEGAEAAAFPGIGTDEALENPRCDPESGRVAIPLRRAVECVRAWPADGDNGGATAPGVTADAIRIVIRLSPTATAAEDEVSKKLAEQAMDVYAHHYETWGRRWELVFHKAAGNDEAAQRADAVEIATTIKPFAALSNAATGNIPVWETELAARGIMVFGWVVPWEDTQAQAGYRWAYSMDDRHRVTHVGEMVGKILAGLPAKHAGDEAMHARERVFGLLYPESSRIDVEHLESILAEYGAELAVKVAYPSDAGAQAPHARTAIARMRDAGVTSLISFQEFTYGMTLTTQATNDRWFPEWIITGYANSDSTFISRQMDQQQWSNAFGIGTQPVYVRGEVNTLHQLFKWHHGFDPANSAGATVIMSPATALVNAIHLAGPDLTPEAVRTALFAREPAGGAHDDEVATGMATFGTVLGLGWDDYSGEDDMSLKYWDADMAGVDEVAQDGKGMYVRLAGAKRYTVGQYPKGEQPWFDDPDGVVLLDKYPARERPPSYEHTAEGTYAK